MNGEVGTSESVDDVLGFQQENMCQQSFERQICSQIVPKLMGQQSEISAIENAQELDARNVICKDAELAICNNHTYDYVTSEISPMRN